MHRPAPSRPTKPVNRGGHRASEVRGGEAAPEVLREPVDEREIKRLPDVRVMSATRRDKTRHGGHLLLNLQKQAYTVSVDVTV